MHVEGVTREESSHQKLLDSEIERNHRLETRIRELEEKLSVASRGQ